MSVEFYRYVPMNHLLIYSGNISMLGKPGTMEKEMIHQIFCRFLSKYRVKYVSYIGAGDAKVHKYLTSRLPYIDLTIKKL